MGRSLLQMGNLIHPTSILKAVRCGQPFFLCDIFAVLGNDAKKKAVALSYDSPRVIENPLKIRAELSG